MPPDGPFGTAPPEPASYFAWSSRRGGDRDMSAARHPRTQRGLSPATQNPLDNPPSFIETTSRRVGRGQRDDRIVGALQACGRRRPVLSRIVSMKEGRLSSGFRVAGQSPLWVRGWRAGAPSLYRLLGGRTRRNRRPVPGAQFQKGRQAARRFVAPPGAGAKGSLRVSMCQIASVSFLAISICATLAPRCLPRRCLLRW